MFGRPLRVARMTKPRKRPGGGIGAIARSASSLLSTSIKNSMSIGASLSAHVAQVGGGGEEAPVSTTNHKYVRQGAGGTASGNDWTNAYTDLPTTLSRDTTYWIADGNYGAHQFADNLNGTQIIQLRKATATYHGTETGWDSAYGNGEAIWEKSSWSFMAPWQFGRQENETTGYYIFDGATGSGKSPGGYGFRLKTTTTYNRTSGALITMVGETTSMNNVTIKHIEFDLNDGQAASIDVSYAMAFYSAMSNLLIKDCYIHHTTGAGIFLREGGNPWNRRTMSDVTLDNIYFHSLGGGGDVDHHWEIFWITGITNLTIRNCTTEDVFGASDGQTGWWMLGAIDNLNVYNNLFFCNPGATQDGDPLYINNTLIGYWSGLPYTCDGVNIYNNTFVNVPSGANFYFPSSGTVNYRNNLYYTSAFVFDGATTQSHEAFGGGVSSSGTNAQTGLTTAIFTNYASDDYTLASNTTAGVDLSGVFTTDKNGTTRSAWDRGAYEKV